MLFPNSRGIKAAANLRLSALLEDCLFKVMIGRCSHLFVNFQVNILGQWEH